MLQLYKFNINFCEIYTIKSSQNVLNLEGIKYCPFLPKTGFTTPYNFWNFCILHFLINNKMYCLLKSVPFNLLRAINSYFAKVWRYTYKIPGIKSNKHFLVFVFTLTRLTVSVTSSTSFGAIYNIPQKTSSNDALYSHYLLVHSYQLRINWHFP